MGALVTQTLRFGVLGPLEVLRDGESLPLGGERQRALLALLLLHCNELVATEQLVDQLFGEESSEGTVNALYVAVSRLRRLIQGVGGGELLLTRPGGYLLVTEPGALDVQVFEGLLGEAMRLRADGNPDSASARLREALAMWRGPPFADVASLEFLQQEIRRLEELRLVALMERIDADLALGRDAELIGELEMLVGSNPLQERLRAQLMIALYRAGRQTDALAVYRDTSELLRDELGLDPSKALQQLEHAVLTQDSSLELAPREAARAASVVCPFKGLASFDRADARYFCGRERVVSDLTARLASSPLVGIVGASGIGKSSLLRAGVLGSLSDGALPGSGGWRQVLVRPGAHPVAELARALDGDDPMEVLGRLRPGERLVIAVDQLEELFTVCEDEAERAAFLEALAAAAGDAAGRALVIVALRGDFYGRVASYSRFARLLSHNHVLVGPMDREELAQAIERPAARAGLEVERALVDGLVHDVEGEPGGLPLLSTALLELWRDRDGRALRYDSYRRSGGVQGAVARLAEDAYAGLSASDRAVARQVLLRLASGADRAVARRRVALAELARIDGAASVLAALTDARLLTVSDDEIEVSHEALIREWPRYRAWLDEDRVGRRVHEHLAESAREWGARRGESADLYRGARLAAALDWSAQHADELSPSERDFLAASRRQSEREARRLRAVLVGVAVLLAVSIGAGIVALAQQRTARSEARVALSRELGAEAVNQPRIDVAMLLAREAVNLDRSPQTEGTLLATLLRGPAVIGTIPLPSNAEASLAFSPDGRTLAAADGLGELRLFDARTHALRAAPLGGVSVEQPPVYSSDGTLLAHRATECPCGFIVVRDARSLQTVANLPLPVTAPESPSDIPGGSIAIAPDDHSVYYAYWSLGSAEKPGPADLVRWPLPGGTSPLVIPLGSGALLALRLVGDGSRLLVVNARSVRVLDARSLRLLSTVAITPAPVAPTAAAVSPDGRVVAIGSQDGSVSFLDTSTGQLRAAVPEQRSAIATVLFPSNGRTVVSIGSDDSVAVWDPRTGSPVDVLGGPAGHVVGAAISPDGRTLYTSSANGVLLEWDLSGARGFGDRFNAGASLFCCDPVTPHAPPLARSPDGSRFAVRLRPSTVGVFSSNTLQLLTSFPTGNGGNVITALAWSPVGDEIAVGGHSGLVQLWTTRGQPKLVSTLAGLESRFGQPEAIQAIAFSSDGQLLAASDDEKIGSSGGTASNADYASLAIWQTSTGRLVASPSGLNSQGGHGVEPFAGDDLLAFSPRGRLLAMSLFDRSIVMFDGSSGDVVQVLAPDAATTSLAFAPDGTLAVGTAVGTVELWNPATGNQIDLPLVVGSTAVTDIAFDRSGQRFVTAGLADGTVKLWFTASLQQQAAGLSTDPGATASAVIEPDGNHLLVVDDAGNGFTWPTALGAWEHRACAVAGRNLSRREWAQLIIGHPYAPVCP
jgi:WD40 repeat protein/DNA-binding SARP family transcriptional activator